MNPVEKPSASSGGLPRAARVIIVSSVMFSFISYWRTAAVVLCDLGSTAYYIGGIVEQSIGPAAPWFILAVMLFSYAVRSVYIESCTLFLRGGVYRVVREALGRTFAKIAVSALIFDYLLTGPISGVSAGQYLMGLGIDSLKIINENWIIQEDVSATVKSIGAVFIALAITFYFFRLNIRGIHESSDRALKIMVATTLMVVVILVWCGATLAVKGIAKSENGQTNALPYLPDLSKKPASKEQPELDPIGVIGTRAPAIAAELRPPQDVNWLSIFGAMGIMIAFGHSILAMSGEETLAQIYREVESPKLLNFRKAAFIVFMYSLVFTAGISFLAVWLIPADQRAGTYSENLISGLAMNVIGPIELRLALNAFVVVIGFLILAGAVNTAIIGSNGVLNRVAEDGVMPDWFLKPHSRYGTTHRLLTLIVSLQVLIICLSRGDVLLLGEAYAFGVVWSFVFQALAMVVLRFKDKRPREYKMPFNLTIRGVEIPFGLLFVLFVLLSAALLNLFTKELATIFGTLFTVGFFTIFYFSEVYHDRKLKGKKHHHLEQFNQETAEHLAMETLNLDKPYRKLVAIRSTQNLIMLEKALADTDPDTTDVIVMTAKSVKENEVFSEEDLDSYDQQLMTAVVQYAEKAGKEVKPLIVPTNNPLHAMLKTAKDLKVQELVVGASNQFTADEQLEQISFFWINLNDGVATPLTVRALGRNRDVLYDLGGGNRIPRLGESRARSVGELRSMGVGVDRVLLVHNDSPDTLDLFNSLLTMLDPDVVLALAGIHDAERTGDIDITKTMREQSDQLKRDVRFHTIPTAQTGSRIVQLAKDEQFDLILLHLVSGSGSAGSVPVDPWMSEVLRDAHCRVFLATSPEVPLDVMDK